MYTLFDAVKYLLVANSDCEICWNIQGIYNMHKLIPHWAAIIFIIHTTKYKEKFINKYVTIDSIFHTENHMRPSR